MAAPPSHKAAPRLSYGHIPFPEPPPQEPPKGRVKLEEAIDQIVVRLERDQLKRRLALHGHHDRFVAAQLAVPAQLRLRLTQRDDFHGGL